MYYILAFPNGSCEMAPDIWMQEDNLCLWPPQNLKSYEVANFIRKYKEPENNWQLLSVTIIGKASSYSEARKKLIKAEKLSDLSTTEPEDCGRGKRRKMAKNLDLPSTSSDSEKENELSQSLLAKLPSVPDSDVVESSLTFNYIPPLTNFTSNVPQHSKSFRTSTSEPQSSQTSREAIEVEEIFDMFQSPAGPSHSSKDSRETPKTSGIPRSQSCQCSKTNSDTAKVFGMFKSIMTEVKLIKYRQSRILELVESNLEKRSHPDVSENLITFQFPCGTEQDLLSINASLDDAKYKNEMIAMLMRIGGNDYKDHARRILRYLMVDAVAEVFSWVGSKDKKRFSSLLIANIIIDAVVQSQPSISRAQVEEVIKTWLRHAKERRLYKHKNTELVL